ncbi:Hypothetical predicted protein [Podarcis lilfordi]|nr:Hypothetical predicted protein [Podarcis lilfordi]
MYHQDGSLWCSCTQSSDAGPRLYTSDQGMSHQSQEDGSLANKQVMEERRHSAKKTTHGSTPSSPLINPNERLWKGHMFYMLRRPLGKTDRMPLLI